MNRKCRCFLIIVSLFCVAWPAVAGAGLFDVRRVFRTGDGPVNVVSGDLDGDGILDLVTPGHYEGDISVLAGTGEGTFESMASVPLGGRLKWAAIGDLDNDGNLDLAVVRVEGSSTLEPGIVSILLGNGDGTFQAATHINDIGMTWYSSRILVEDLDGDANLDLVVATNNFDDGWATVLMGNGDGTFGAPVSYLAGSGCWWLATGDVNNDGNTDIVTANWEDDTVSVLRGTGGGAFGIASSFVVGYRPFSAEPVDLDDDGILDLAVANDYEYGFSPDDVSIFIGNGDGSFDFLVEMPLPSYIDATRIVVSDLNQDGLADLVVSGDQLLVYLGQGGGSFAEPAVYHAYGDGPAVVADLDGDGHLDLAVSSRASDSVYVLRGLGDGTFRTVPTYPARFKPVALVLADLNNDGRLDAVTADVSNHGASYDGACVLLGNGDGTFQPWLHYLTGAVPSDVAAGDLDGDGHQDLVVANHDDFDVSVLLGNGDGTMQPAVDLYCGGLPESVALGHLDGDGNLDLVVAADGNDSVIVGLGRGDGTFRPGGFYDAGGTPTDVVLADLDNDGHEDLVTGLAAGHCVSLRQGLGDGTFERLHYLDGAGCHCVTVALVDGDPVKDLVACHGDDVSVWIGNGDGTFADPVPCSGSSPSTASVTDMDGDGISDLVTCSWYGWVGVHPGSGGGTFGEASLYGCLNPGSMAVGDLDNDGDPDVVTAGVQAGYQVGAHVAVFLNSTSGLVSADLTCTPSSGTLPFPALFRAEMTNTYPGQVRRFQYTINVTTGGGQYYPNWRRGWQNIQPGETFLKQWTQMIPELPTVEGLNVFEMTVADVTPPPYNLPPYPPSGDTDTAGCTVTGAAP